MCCEHKGCTNQFSSYANEESDVDSKENIQNCETVKMALSIVFNYLELFVIRDQGLRAEMHWKNFSF